MKLKPSRLFHARLMTCLLLLTGNTVLAADDIRTQRVNFEQGANSAVVESAITGYETVDYVLECPCRPAHERQPGNETRRYVFQYPGHR